MNNSPLISLENVMALLPNHIYWLDKAGVYQGCNDAQARMMGLVSRHEVIGKRNKDLPCFQDHPETVKMLDENNARVMHFGEVQCLEEMAHDAEGVLSIYRSYKLPLKDADNNVIGLLGSSYKIDDIKANEDKLILEKESVELTLKSIVAHLPGHVYWKDKEGRYLGSNEKQALSLGFESEAGLIGKKDSELPWPEGSAAEFRANDLDVISTGRAKTVEERATMDGKETIVLSQRVPLRNKNNEVYGVLGISLDIPELNEKK